MKDVVKWSVFERYRKEQVNRNTLKIHNTSTYKTLRSESGKPPKQLWSKLFRVLKEWNRKQLEDSMKYTSVEIKCFETSF